MSLLASLATRQKIFSKILKSWPAYFMPLLARAGHLKPLGKPNQNARKWYATVELERVGRDPVWLDKAIRIVDRLVREATGDKKGKGLESPLPGDASLN